MSVSGISGSSTSALYFQRLAASQTSSGTSSSGSFSSVQGQGTPPGPPPGGGGDGKGPPGMSELPDELQTQLQSLFEDDQGQSSPDEIQEKVTSLISEYKETDEYASLSDEDKAAIDEFAEGPKKREEAGRMGVMSELDQLGASAREALLSQFSSISSTSGESTDLQSLLAQLQGAAA